MGSQTIQENARDRHPNVHQILVWTGSDESQVWAAVLYHCHISVHMTCPFPTVWCVSSPCQVLIVWDLSCLKMHWSEVVVSLGWAGRMSVIWRGARGVPCSRGSQDPWGQPWGSTLSWPGALLCLILSNENGQSHPHAVDIAMQDAHPCGFLLPLLKVLITVDTTRLLLFSLCQDLVPLREWVHHDHSGVDYTWFSGK